MRTKSLILALAASSALALAAATPALAIHNGWDTTEDSQSGWQHQRLQYQSQSRMHHHRHRAAQGPSDRPTQGKQLSEGHRRAWPSRPARQQCK